MNNRAMGGLLGAAAIALTMSTWSSAPQGEPQHSDPDWWETHRQVVEPDAASCATCHAQPSCTSCHVDPVPAPITALPEEGGVVPAKREPPPTHTPFFAENHLTLAAANKNQCATCHTRESCLSCHTGSQAVTTPGERIGSYHTDNFLQQHSAAAFSQEVECATCHNPEVFCRSCHVTQGLSGDGRFDTGFHNELRSFVFGHGQAARQGLETCATCHRQSDCIACHSAVGGRRVNPHGPGFDPERLSSRAPSMCLACHTRSILRDD